MYLHNCVVLNNPNLCHIILRLVTNDIEGIKYHDSAQQMLYLTHSKHALNKHCNEGYSTHTHTYTHTNTHAYTKHVHTHARMCTHTCAQYNTCYHKQ